MRSRNASTSIIIDELNAPGGGARKGAKMRAGKLLLEITAYYLVIALALFLALKFWPELRGYLPIGGVEQLITQPAKNPLQASEAVRAAHVANFGQSVFWLVVAIIAAILVSLPISWTYMAVRGGEESTGGLSRSLSTAAHFGAPSPPERLRNWGFDWTSRPFRCAELVAKPRLTSRGSRRSILPVFPSTMSSSSSAAASPEPAGFWGRMFSVSAMLNMTWDMDPSE
jgi:hypothetical protein